eukprot:GHUV01049124.1.p1 GENE.GHUV01049124.1~~GHUV01049124.1.p1  ORF type:complete len:108 (+),score=18.70 GHUV01049124.1:214-537(+)
MPPSTALLWFSTRALHHNTHLLAMMIALPLRASPLLRVLGLYMPMISRSTDSFATKFSTDLRALPCACSAYIISLSRVLANTRLRRTTNMKDLPYGRSYRELCMASH